MNCSFRRSSAGCGCRWWPPPARPDGGVEQDRLATVPRRMLPSQEGHQIAPLRRVLRRLPEMPGRRRKALWSKIRSAGKCPTGTASSGATRANATSKTWCSRHREADHADPRLPHHRLSSPAPSCSHGSSPKSKWTPSRTTPKTSPTSTAAIYLEVAPGEEDHEQVRHDRQRQATILRQGHGDPRHRRRQAAARPDLPLRRRAAGPLAPHGGRQVCRAQLGERDAVHPLRGLPQAARDEVPAGQARRGPPGGHHVQRDGPDPLRGDDRARRAACQPERHADLPARIKAAEGTRIKRQEPAARCGSQANRRPQRRPRKTA